MPRNIRTAVAAIAAPQVQRDVLRAISAAGISLSAMVEDGYSARQRIADLRPDLLIADMELPAMEGTSLARKILGSCTLPVRPAVMILRYPHFPIIGEDALIASGAVFVDKPVSLSAFGAAVDALRASNPVFCAEELRRTDELLEDLGVPDHIGRRCLMYAALICATDETAMHNLSGRLYPLAGSYCKLNAAQAERAMRHAIDLAWQSDKFDNQYRIFADTVDAGRGQPTCGEMISRLADILRLEG